jgi:hypothetical protein
MEFGGYARNDMTTFGLGWFSALRGVYGSRFRVFAAGIFVQWRHVSMYVAKRRKCMFSTHSNDTCL